MDTRDINESPVLDQLGDQIARERSSVRNVLHMWWARLPGVTARTAVFANLVPQSEETALLLTELGSHPVSEKTVEKAAQEVLRVFNSELEEDSTQEQPRLLDPFSGSGSISLAASRLGAEAYAVDINPVAYILQLCRLTFPQRFGKADKQFRGTDQEGKWAGLAKEVQYWSAWLDERVQAEAGQLYPPLETEGAHSPFTLQAYFWSFTTVCKNQSCGVQFPLINFPYLVKNSKRELAFQLRADEKSGTVSVFLSEQADQSDFQTIQRGQAICPLCGTKKPLGGDDIQESQLIAVLAATDVGNEYLVQCSRVDICPEDAFLDQRIDMLLHDTGIPPLVEELSHTFADHRYGIDTYSEIFSKRQLLFLLTIAKHIPLAHGRMLSQRYDPERAAAVATYLGLLLSNLANHHNKHCRWQAVREQPQPIFAYQHPAMAWTYVEMNPFASAKSLQAYSERLTRAIEINTSLGSPALVRCASATALPYPDGYFDGVVTAAPYYDAIPYADLSDLYFIWLKRSIGHLYQSEFSSDLTPKTDEIVVVHGSQDKRGIAAYREKLGRALVEVGRVLKPGHFFTMIVPTAKADVLQDFLVLTQAAGLELVGAMRARTEPIMTLRDDSVSHQVLLTFRKSKLVQHASQVLVDAATVLRLTDEGEPSLCTGLAQLLMNHLEIEDLECLIPKNYRGSLTTRLIEYVNGCENPGDLLGELGRTTLRKIVRERGLPEESGDAKGEILKSFGFNVPEPEQTGINSLLSALPRYRSQVKLASSKEDLRGIFLTVATEFESMLKRSVWAWGTVVFGVERDAYLQELIQKELNRLSQGDFQRLFLGLPAYVAGRGFGDHSEQLLHRPHLYSTKKLTANFDSIVAFRNRIEHNKQEYLTNSSLDQIRSDMDDCLGTIVLVLEELKKRAAMPLIARPVRETTDVFGRRSYELKVEDGSVIEVYMTEDLALGRDYYLFPTESNPRPVDPPMLLVSSVLGELP